MARILDTIESPQDLRRLTPRELTTLASEIRSEILSVISKNGGHLAPNLGVVELTLALHLSFSSPKDRIIWDVGHQSYVHKLITGRRKEFSTIRLYKGLSGFPKRGESPHDVFETGHSSTSISAGVGMAVARDLAGEDYAVVCVIGDGAMTGGLAFEALNHAGHLGTNLIVVLNDNEMSISKNVGALAAYLGTIRSDPALRRIKDDVMSILKSIPAIGPVVADAAKRLKDSVKYLVVPGMLFEELGFKYIGPIDGHNIDALKRAFSDAKALGGPVLVHAVTQKGKGYKPAMENPTRFHGTGPFDLDTGEPVGPPAPAPSWTSFFSKWICEAAEREPALVAITAAMPDGTGLDRFRDRFPERFFDVAIAEQHAVTFAAGAASQGLRPVVAVYSTFLQRAYDQIVHDVALQNLPVVLAIDRAGIVGEDGHTHQGVFDIAFLRHIPNVTVMAPKDENELRCMMAFALQHRGPSAIRYPRGPALGVPIDPELRPVELGRAEILTTGSDVGIIALGTMVYPALWAAEILKRDGIDAAVVNARFVKPLDREAILRVARQTGRLITVEEGVRMGGFGSAVLELLADAGLSDVPVTVLGVPDEFIEHGARETLLMNLGLSSDGIATAAREMARSRARARRVVR